MRSLAAAAVAADAALADLDTVLADAIDHARTGAALAVAGSLPPAPELESAADGLVADAQTADTAGRAMVALAGTAAAVAPATHLPTPSLRAPSLQLIAAGLRSTADAATLFVERRHATEEVVSALGDAVVDLENSQPAAALQSLDRTTAPLALLDAWQERPALFRYWMMITRDLLDAARGIANATLAGDPAAVRVAAERYAKAGVAARGADNALAVTISEEGAALSGTALRALASAAADTADERAAVQPLLRAGS